MKRRILTALALVCFILGVLILVLTDWYTAKFNTSFAGLLFTLVTPMQGVGTGFWEVFTSAILPPLAWAVAAYLLLLVWFRGTRLHEAAEKKLKLLQKTEKARNIIGKILIGAGFLTLAAALVFSWVKLNVSDYVRTRSAQTKIYEEYYVDPNSVEVTAPAEKPNVIWLVLESMETTYASREEGGMQDANYMPNLTKLANGNISFSNTEKLGGLHATNNTNWTMAALFAGTSGLPFGFPVDQNSMNKYTEFAPEIAAMGDILKRDGYVNEFLCGSDAAYGGRKLYFEEHGAYEIYDLFTARENGDIPSDYYVFWGYEDRHLFRIAKQELMRLYETGEPFNLTMLTVDAHHLGGYTCEECGNEYPDRTANVIACTDRQVGEFIEWCEAQPFYENTVIIITGDHPRMDTFLTEGVDYQDRTIYNCFLNARKTPEGETTNRTSVMMDLYPTMLSAMGYTIEGDRLGLGTDLFSAAETLAEQMGYDELDEEVSKYSEYFVTHFAR